MSLLFDLLYISAGVAGSPVWLYKLAISEKMRAVMRGKFAVPPRRESSQDAFLAHCASLGEVLLARGLIEGLGDALPGWQPMISYNTPTALATVKKHFPGHIHFYSPIDLSRYVSRGLDRLRPSLILLMELELWPNLILLARRRGIPVAVVNGRISEKAAARYGLVRSLFKPVLDAVDVFAMQSAEYADRIAALGADPARVHVTGSMKYDNVSTDQRRDAELALELGIEPSVPVIVGGCTYAGEDEALIAVYRELRVGNDGLRLILAPRHPERLKAVEAAIADAGLPSVRRSQLSRGAPPGAAMDNAVLLVDTVGELERIYSLATVAFVGGSLIPRGGHNIMEPAGRGKPVLVGPHTANFADAVTDLNQAGGLEILSGERELRRRIAELVADPTLARDIGSRAREAILQQKGATRRTIDLLIPLTKPR